MSVDKEKRKEPHLRGALSSFDSTSAENFLVTPGKGRQGGRL